MYLDPAEHRYLVALAARRGLSLTALVREIVSRFVAEAGGHHAPKSFGAISGIVDVDAPGDVSAEPARYRDQALARRYRQKLGAPLRVAESARKRPKRKRDR